MKKLLFLASELLGLLFVALVFGKFVDEFFSLKGWGLLFSVLGAYVLWFFLLYKARK